MTRLAKVLSKLHSGAVIRDMGDHYYVRYPSRRHPLIVYRDGRTRRLTKPRLKLVKS
jgi:hypothetical protein